jgi:hypothetical protein
MLMVLRRARFDEGGCVAEFGAVGIFGRLEVATWWGRAEGRGDMPDGDRLGRGRPVEEGFGVDGDWGTESDDCRVFGTGMEGSGAVGGREGRGRAVVAMRTEFVN